MRRRRRGERVGGIEYDVAQLCNDAMKKYAPPIFPGANESDGSHSDAPKGQPNNSPGKHPGFLNFLR